MKLGNKMIMTKEQFEYSLNAILYCMWLIGLKQNTTSINRFKAIFVPLTDFLTTKNYKKKFHERLKKGEKEFEAFYQEKNNGFQISRSIHYLGFFYSMYPLYIGLILGGIYIRFMYPDVNPIWFLILPAIPIGIAFLPLNKAVYSHDKYIGYFKRFEKENEQWLKKWKLRTILFCIGGILIDILGILTLFAILLTS